MTVKGVLKIYRNVAFQNSLLVVLVFKVFTDSVLHFTRPVLKFNFNQLYYINSVREIERQRY